MPYDLFKRIVDEIAAENPETELYPAFMGEPLMYRPIMDGIKYAKAKGLKKVYINTNSMLMGEKQARELLDAGPDRIIASIDGFSKSTYEERRIKGNYERVLENVQRLLKLKYEGNYKVDIWTQLIIDEGNQHEEAEYVKFWTDLGANVKVRSQITWGGHAQAVQKNYLADVKVDRIPCPWLVRQMGIAWNGDVVLCNADPEAQAGMGNIYKQSIKEVWMTKFRDIQLQHQDGDFSHPFCKNCDDWKAGKSDSHFHNKGATA
jgi:radical SAM protein with 4Fe4S-binding SPASM domain